MDPSAKSPEQPRGQNPVEPHPVIAQLLARIASRASADRRDALVAFAKSYTRRISDEELLAGDVEDLAGQVSSAFSFVDSRGTEPIAVRAFDPVAGRNGYETTGTVLETSTDDTPFLVDSVSDELAARSLPVRRLLHPVIGTMRDERGRLERVLPAREAAHRESVMHFEIARRLGEKERQDLEKRVSRILHDVRLVVRDFEPMQQRVRDMIELARAAAVRYDPQEVGEAVDFLEWLLQLNFVLLGYREYDLLETPDGRAIAAVVDSGLGILSDPSRSTYAHPTPLRSIDPALRRRFEEGDLLVYSKTNSYSTVHRRARMDYIGVRKIAPDGGIVGEARLVGLFTSKAYMERHPRPGSP